jgi:hypothetical protein
MNKDKFFDGVSGKDDFWDRALTRCSAQVVGRFFRVKPFSFHKPYYTEQDVTMSTDSNCYHHASSILTEGSFFC